ncbi:MAG: sugar phosphate isomerase/epimerase [Planctomycetaceae bacterium]|nr:sugar phosphate isomerase/epimerase [Planctomycetaceae bacterium]
MQRRTFLKTAGATGLATILARPLWAMSPKFARYKDTMGLQLYTLRNQIKDDLPGTIRAVAEAGYYQVELTKTVGAEPDVKAAQDAGLKVTSAMIDSRVLVTPDAEGVPTFDAILETAGRFELRYLVIPYIGKGNRETVDQFKANAERANRMGEKCKAAGIQLCYHNHAFEFGPLPGGKTGWDVFLEEFEPGLVKLELDVFWAAIGGKDPAETIRTLKGRIAQLHLKDLKAGVDTTWDESKVPRDAFQEVGDGVVDWNAVLQAAEETGVAQCHVEQDQSPDPVASIGQSMRYLKKL